MGGERLLTEDALRRPPHLPVPHAALIGAIFVLWPACSRPAPYPAIPPAGVATAVFGAPYLIFLAIRQSRVRQRG